jgi:hypothetical protein
MSLHERILNKVDEQYDKNPHAKAMRAKLEAIPAEGAKREQDSDELKIIDQFHELRREGVLPLQAAKTAVAHVTGEHPVVPPQPEQPTPYDQQPQA